MNFKAQLFILLFVCLLSCPNCIAQFNFELPTDYASKPYKTNWQIEAPILILSSGLTISQMIMKDKTPLSSEFIATLNRDNINSFDRGATYNYSSKAKKASDYFLYGSMSAPMLLLADKKIRDDWRNVMLVSSETFLVGMGITLLAKNLSHRARPFLYNSDVSIEDKLSGDGVNSFFSGHTSMTALSTFMMAKIIVDYHPDTKLKPLIWSTAAAIPLTTGMLRYRAGKHFLSDVFAGFAVGAFTGYMVPHIHHMVQQKRNRNSNTTTNFFGDKIKIKELLVDSIEF